MKFDSLKDAESFLNKFQFHGFRLGLERIEAALKALGNPEREYPSIHVAGTNGKGSVCAITSSILEKAGLRVGFYSSPHLFRLNERFRINLSPVSDEKLKALIEGVASLIEKGCELSYFEFTTAMAFLYFRWKKVDIAIIETGLGGRLDATNCISPLVTAITNISLEHTAYLGRTIKKIAFEKAGIIKRGCPCICGNINETAFRIIEKVAQKKDVRIRALGRDFFAKKTSNSPLKQVFSYKGELEMEGLSLGLLGDYQVENAASSIAICEELRKKGFRIEEWDIREGLKSAYWPCRNEIIKVKGGYVLLDGAHNESGLKRLSNFLKDLIESIRPKTTTLIFAASNEGEDKDFSKMLKIISPFFDRIIITEPKGPRRPVTIDEWKACIQGSNIEFEKELKKTVEKGVFRKPRPFLTVVAGSLYLIGPFRKILSRLDMLA